MKESGLKHSSLQPPGLKSANRKRAGRKPAWTIAAMLAAALLLGNCALAGEAAEKAGKREPYLWTKTVRGDFEQVIADIKSAAGSRNFPVTNVRDFKKRFDQRLERIGGGTIPYAHYTILEFCNLMLGIESLRKDARMGVFMPCRMVVYARAGSGEVVLMTVNPYFMPEVLHNAELRAIARQVEQVILEIFDAVDD